MQWLLEEPEPLPIDRLVPRYRDPQLEEGPRPVNAQQ